ncbi:MAG: hypothetical protein JRH06_15075 [Deltaproteobacteria bacterium]|nr:hypothetical protein [Deltaproteobacteria bacterium]
MKKDQGEHERGMIGALENLPWVSFYARTRGRHFVLAWAQRISGMLLVLMLVFHALAYPPEPGQGSVFLAFVAWLAAIPLMFHALNGSRLLLYEIFGVRKEQEMLRWLLALAAALIPAWGVGLRLRGLGHSVLWTLQRISAGLLLVLVPAFGLYLQLTPVAGQAGLFPSALEAGFVRGVHVLFLATALFHGGYGLWSTAADYVSSRVARAGIALLISALMVALGWAGTGFILAH